MVKKKTKKKINTRKKAAKIAKRAKKRVKEIPESVYGQKIEIQQQVQPIIEAVIEETQPEVQNEIFEDSFEDSNEELEIKVVEDQEIQVMSNEKDLDNKQKHILMYIAISCIMVVVLFFWLVSVKSSFGQNFEKTDSDQEISSFINEIGSSIKSMTNYIDNQKKQIADFTTEAKGVIIEEKIKQDISGKIKDQLENSNVNSITNQ